MRDCELEFQVFCETVWGEELRIAGSLMELGGWPESKGSLKLTTNKDIYPKWKCNKKIVLKRNTYFEFKVWIQENGELKRWEDLPQNRHYTVHNKRVKLSIYFSQPVFDPNLKLDHQLSKEFTIDDPVRKYDEKNLHDDDEGSSSSFENFDGFRVYEDFTVETTFNLGYIASVYKEFIARFEIKEAKIDVGYAEGRVSNIARKIVHVARVVTEGEQRKDEVQKRNNFIPVEIEVDQQYVENSMKIAAQVMQQMTLEQCYILHQLQMSLVVKLIRKNIRSDNNHKIGLFISSLHNIQNILAQIQLKDLIESLILTNVLLFPSFQSLTQTLDLIQSFGILITLHFHSFGHYTLNIYDRSIMLKVIDPKDQFNITDLEFLSIHPESVIKKRIENIKFNEEQRRYAKVIIFSFGMYENFNIMMKNKDVINKLAQTHHICVFTPSNLKEHSEVIATFPKALFVSYTYLEMAYMNTIKYIDGLVVFSKEFLKSVNQLVYDYPSVKQEFANSYLFIKNTDLSSLGVTGFESLTNDMEKLINQTNRTRTTTANYLNPNKQNKSLTLTRINSSTLLVRQVFQTQLFFTKVILQTIESPIDFIFLFIFNRFQNFRFLEELKSVASEKNLNATVIAYTLGYVKNRHCYNLDSSGLTQILDTLVEQCMRRVKSTVPIKKFSIGGLK